MWTLSVALRYIRLHRPELLKYGYALDLGGSVLMKGRSNNDLDLLAIKVKSTARFKLLRTYFPGKLVRNVLDGCADTIVFSIFFEGRERKVQILIPKPC
jgi:hypothetical protein